MWVEQAARIGDRLVRTALRNGSSCTWEVVVSDRQRPAEHVAVQAMADGDVYQGTAGIALFLAGLWSKTADRSLVPTIEGALEHALSGSRRAGLGSFYSGDLGRAYAMVRWGVLSGHEEWLARGRVRLAIASAEHVADHAQDVIGGAAGAVLGLLAIERATAWPELLPLALKVGRHALASATRRPYGWSWRGTAGIGKQDLCGYAHGASGFAHAFLELYARTGDAEWRFAATRAMDYESRHALSPLGDWPDYRNVDLALALLPAGGEESLRQRLRAGGRIPRSACAPMRAWCHGAPGIALARLRALTLGVEVERSAREFEAAIRVIRSDLDAGNQRNCSLCHGAFGNAETLLWAHAFGHGDHHAYVSALTETAIRTFGATDGGWPSGSVSTASDPSLLLGDAGIGLFMLRLEDPQVPSALFLSDWRPTAAPPAASRGAMPMVRRETLSLLDPLERTLAALPPTSPVRQDVEQVLSSAPSVEDGVARIAELLSGTEVALDPIRSAIAPRLEQIEEDRRHDDYSLEYCRRLMRPRLKEVQLSDARLRRAADARIVWGMPADGSDEATAGDTAVELAPFVLFRSATRVHVQETTRLTAACLEALEQPATIAQLQRILDEELEVAESSRSEVTRAVEALVRNALDAGIIVADMGVAT